MQSPGRSNQAQETSYFLARLKMLLPLQGLIVAVRGAGRMRYGFIEQ